MSESSIFDEFDRLHAQHRGVTAPIVQSSSGGHSTISANYVVQSSSITNSIMIDIDEDEEHDEDEEEDDEDDEDEIVIRPNIGFEDLCDKKKYFDEKKPFYFTPLTELNKDIVECLEAVYPGMWSISGNTTIIILFRDIEIVNSRGLKHQIKDLFVKFYIDSRTSQMAVDLSGRRGTYSVAELISDYAHSHLPGRCISNFEGFCLGSDYIIDCMRSVKEWSVDREKYKKRLMGFLFQLGEYVRYESLEGRPFRYIDNIGISANDYLDDTTLRVNVNSIISSFKKTEFVPDYSIDVNRQVIQIIDSIEYESNLSSAVTIHQLKDRFGIFFTSGGYSSEDSVKRFLSSSSEIEFRGQTFFPIVDMDSAKSDNDVDKTKYCHRKIKQRFERLFINHLKYEWKQASTGILEREYETSINERRKSEDKQRFSLENITIVSTDS